ncbi:unnamed protein product [Staurois parvus]|uniref:Uncharacterized protein n=1 Tax=Staurois parvus TaxID=386267 RepID=A0ABN9ET63_9NEOB|nr:unnamed protein product [Staurois parvus]
MFCQKQNHWCQGPCLHPD